jgi:hypothetical protein
MHFIVADAVVVLAPFQISNLVRCHALLQHSSGHKNVFTTRNM